MPSVLYLVHGLPPEDRTGTPLAALGYAAGVAGHGWDATVVYASPSAPEWSRIEARRESDESFDRVAVPPPRLRGVGWSITEASGIDPPGGPSEVAFPKLLDQIRPDIVHVVDNVDLPLDWPEIASARGLPVLRTVTCAEDLCALIAPVSPRSEPAGYCSGPITPERCAECVASLPSLRAVIEVGMRRRRRVLPPSSDSEGCRDELLAMLERKRARAALQYSSVYGRVVFATRGFRRYFEQTLPLDPCRVRVIEMGLDTAGWDRSGDRQPRRSGQPLVFCLAATLDPAKGLSTVVEAFTSPELVDRDDYQLELHGGGNPQLVSDLLSRNRSVHLHGPYTPDGLPGILARADIGLSTSCFETFHRVTREYLLAGLPVIGSRAFGIPDIIRHRKNGVLFDHADPGSLTRAVTALLDDPLLVDHLTEGARATAVRTLDDEVDDLLALYDEMLAERQ